MAVIISATFDLEAGRVEFTSPISGNVYEIDLTDPQESIIPEDDLSLTHQYIMIGTLKLLIQEQEKIDKDGIYWQISDSNNDISDPALYAADFGGDDR